MAPNSFYIVARMVVVATNILYGYYSDYYLQSQECRDSTTTKYKEKGGCFFMTNDKTEETKKPKTKDERGRNFTTLIYEESAKPDWQEILRDEHIPCAYIRHDKDPKKVHWHIIFAFEGKKSMDQVQELVDKIGGANGQFKPIHSLRAMARYLCHMDDPDKAQYDSKEVHTIALDYNALVNLPSDKYQMIGEMMDFCEENGIFAYYDLIGYARVHRFDWFKCLCDSSTMVMKEYLKSKQWAFEQAMRNDNK